jgi:hypothetical protein
MINTCVGVNEIQVLKLSPRNETEPQNRRHCYFYDYQKNEMNSTNPAVVIRRGIGVHPHIILNVMVVKLKTETTIQVPYEYRSPNVTHHTITIAS